MVWHHENQVAATRGKQRVTKLRRRLGGRETTRKVEKRSSAELKTPNALEKEKRIMWNKSGKESAKREAGLYTMLEKCGHR